MNTCNHKPMTHKEGDNSYYSECIKCSCRGAQNYVTPETALRNFWIQFDRRKK